MLRRFDVNYAAFSLLVDAGVVAGSLYVAELLRPDLYWLPFSQRISPNEGLPAILYLGAPLLWVTTLSWFALYDPRAVVRTSTEFRLLLLGSLLAGLAEAGLLYLSYR